MIIHRINHASTQIETSDVPETDLQPILIGDQGATLLSVITSGQAAFVDGHWMFGEQVMTIHGLQPAALLEIKAGFQPHNGSNGNCDAHWIEIRQLVHRSAAAIGRPLTREMSGGAGQLT